MSLNAWGGVLHTALIAYLRESDPDVLCLQEVVHSPAARSDWLTYRDGDHVLPQRANLHREVAEALPDHTATFCPAAEGTLFDGDAPVPSRWGLATYVRDDLAVIGQVQAFVHKAYAPDGFGEHPRSRVAHGIRVHDRRAGRAVSIVQMHGLRDPATGKRDTPERRAQARKLMDLTTAVAEPGDGIVVCGDFNVEPGSETFAILGGLGLRDLVTGRGFPGTRSSHYRKPGRFADYMLVNGAITVTAFDVVTSPEVSDHCPLVLTI